MPGNPQCIGSYVMNAFGFLMEIFKKNRSSFVCQDAADKISRLFDYDFQRKTMEANDKKDEEKLIELFSSKSVELEFV